MSTEVDAFVGLGANIGDPEWQVRTALERLAELPGGRLHAASRLYVSRPMGPQDQPDFINAVAWLRTNLSPHELLAALQRLEADAGRERSDERWGPRPLDLDLLLWGSRRLDDAYLTLPHPGIGERPFVLVPLAEIAPEVEIPGGARAVELAQRVDAGTLRPLTDRQA